MEKLNLQQKQQLLLNLLIEFDKICKINNINYSLTYGTLIGAARHKGFIPWDDDIDVMMTRENFNKFIALKNSFSNTSYQIVDNKQENYNYIFAKFVDKTTKLVLLKEERYPTNLGLYIDIFPFDYVADTKEEAYKIVKRNRFKLSLLVAAQWKKYFLNKSYNFKRQLIRLFFYILSRFVNSKKIICKIEKNMKKEETKYCCNFGSFNTKAIFETSLFNNLDFLVFENHKFPVIKNYDYFLSTIYGDYKKLPPEDKRFSPHEYDSFKL
ncbi:MAG: LicD family protein [Bacilli bacterium]|nr:LicD family protein [Bacilli bacterium]